MQTQITHRASLLNGADRRKSALLPISPRRRLSKWASLVVGVYLIALGVQFFVLNEKWQWGTVLAYLFSQQVMAGLLNTILLTVLSTVIGLVLGMITTWARLSDLPLLRLAAGAYIWIVRATPLLVILLMIFFLGALVPSLGIGIPFLAPLVEVPTNAVINRFTAAVVGLSIYLGGKSAEVFRSGVISINSGQFEACKALGMSPLSAYTRIIGPQIIRVITPSLANEVITMFKNTSLVSVIGYAELLTTVELIYARNFQTIPLLMVAVIWYLVLTSLAMYGQARLEKRFGRGFNRRVVSKAHDPVVQEESAKTEEGTIR